VGQALSRARKLRDRRARRDAGLFLVEGEHLLTEAARSGLRVVEAFVAEGRAAPAGLAADRVHRVSPHQMRLLAETETPQGIVAVVAMPQASPPPRPGLQLLLDGVGDPGNLGAVLRAAVAFGAVRCLLGPGCVDPWNGKALRAAAGATFRLVPEDVADLAAACRSLDGHVVYGLVPRGGTPLPEAALPPRTAFVLGNEAHGISAALMALARPHPIPMAGPVVSLNAATALAVAAYAWRQAQLRPC
jgi:TrmH family RNA methyltransferase